jgi:hypothetical protein
VNCVGRKLDLNRSLPDPVREITLQPTLVDHRPPAGRLWYSRRYTS